MTPEEIKSMQAYAAAAFGQAEAGEQFSEDGKTDSPAVGDVYAANPHKRVPAPCQCNQPPKLYPAYIEGTTGGLEVEHYFCETCGADYGMTEAWGFGACLAVEALRTERDAVTAHATQLAQDYERTAGEIHELCRLLNISVTWSEVPGLMRNPHDLLAQITKSVLSLKDKVKLAKPYVGAVDNIHRTLCDVPDGYEFTVVERAIFDMAEDTLMGIPGAANGGSEPA